MAKYTPFGLAVKIQMLKKDIETAEMARKIGTSPQYFLDILKGARPGKEIKPKIAEILGIDEVEGANSVMVTIVINRTTGERKIVDVYPDSSDSSLEVIGNLLAKMIIEHGLFEKFNKTSQSVG